MKAQTRVLTSVLRPTLKAASPLTPQISLQLVSRLLALNTLRLRQNGYHFPDDIFRCIFLKENLWISIKISLKFIPTGAINNISALVQIIAWRRPGDKLLSEPMMIILPAHIYVTRPQWVNSVCNSLPNVVHYKFDIVASNSSTVHM